MKKKFVGISDTFSLLNGKVYEVISIEEGWYRIVDETGEDYLYPPDFFVEPDEDGSVDSTVSDYIKSIMTGEITDIEVIG